MYVLLVLDMICELRQYPPELGDGIADLVCQQVHSPAPIGAFAAVHDRDAKSGRLVCEMDRQVTHLISPFMNW